MKRMNNLIEENTKLREENRQLRDYINSKGMGSIPVLENNDVNIHTRMHKKLETLEEIERDQKGRERELEDYHNWLHSIPVKYEGEEYSLEIKERLKLMETSVKMQSKELERTKKLFLRDTQIVKDELTEKLLEIQSIQNKLKEKEDYIRVLEQKTSSVTPLRNASVEHTKHDHHSPKITSNHNFKSLIHDFKEHRELVARQLNTGIASFRDNLYEMMKEYLGEVLNDSPILPTLCEEIKCLIEGCSEALEETILESQRVFSSHTNGIMKKVILFTDDTHSENHIEKSIQTDEFATIGTAPSTKDTVEFFKTCLKQAGKQQDKDAWDSLVSKTQELRNQESRLFIMLGKSKNSLERIMQHVAKLEQSSPEAFSFYRNNLQEVLSLFIKQTDMLVKNSFLENRKEQ